MNNMNYFNNMNTSADNSTTQTSSEVSDQYLIINKEAGLKFCMDDEDFYKEILSTFIGQADKFLSQLKEHYDIQDWGNYAIVAHTLKSNTRTIGADNFAELSLKHELAGKAKDDAFITENYEQYIAVLKALIERAKTMV